MGNKIFKVLNMVSGILMSILAIALFPLHYFNVIKLSSWLLVIILLFVIGLDMLFLGMYLSDIKKKKLSLTFSIFASLVLITTGILLFYLSVTNQVTLF